jgi:superfamily II DNA or RNA helicase
MIRISAEEKVIVLQASVGDLAARHQSQLAFWGFAQPREDRFECSLTRALDTVNKLVQFFQKSSLPFELSSEVTELLDAQQDVSKRLHNAIRLGRQFKNAEHLDCDLTDFITFASSKLHRRLKDHQLKAAIHLLTVENGANFSVPGSGKTSVILAVFEWLRFRGEVDALFVVGPPSCFGPWRSEYHTVLGRHPSYELLAGGDVEARHSKYLVNATTTRDLYLTSFQTLQRDWEKVRTLFEHQGARFFLVIDEAHYIKQVNGAWANAVLGIARHATKRCVLTGTPFPRTYEDGFNLFDILWPDSPPLSGKQRLQIVTHSEQKDFESAAKLMNESIGPLFYRVRKPDLHLAPQIFHPPVMVQMNTHERLVYDAILDRIQDLAESDYFKNLELLVRLRRGRMIRLRQCLSYVPLLETAVTEYSEQLVRDNVSLSDLIKHYGQLERPAKLEQLVLMVGDLLQKGEKVVIWSNFVRTLEYIRETMEAMDVGVRLIYGATPIEDRSVDDELTRERIIEQFVDPNSDVRILVANPAACAESISLHKSCSHAIYYDLSYNCAQYVQSLDRIHRVGGSEERPAHYYFLQYDFTVDRGILANVQRKAENMSRVVDQDYPVYTLNMFGEDEELEAYEQLFGGRKRV